MAESTLSSNRLSGLRTEMRVWFLVQSFLVWAAGGQLFVLSEQTGDFFAWTINPPLTAAFLGASYWATLFLMFLSAWEPAWPNSRVAGPATWVFSTLTLIFTLLHLSRFHLDTVFGWVWLFVYITVPVVLLVLLVRQQFGSRNASLNAAQAEPSSVLPGWFKIALVLQAFVLLVPGVALFIAPTELSSWWSWSLTALTGRAVAAWLIGWSVALIHAVWENRWNRIHNFMIAYTWLGILNLVALLRYPATPRLSELSGWLYLLFIGLILLTGVVGWWLAHKARSNEDRVSFIERINQVTRKSRKEQAL